MTAPSPHPARRRLTRSLLAALSVVALSACSDSDTPSKQGEGTDVNTDAGDGGDGQADDPRDAADGNSGADDQGRESDAGDSEPNAGDAEGNQPN